jgi:hypothetical protein
MVSSESEEESDSSSDVDSLLSHESYDSSSVEEYDIDPFAIGPDADDYSGSSSSGDSVPIEPPIRVLQPLPYVGENRRDDDLIYCRLQEEMYLHSFSLPALHQSHNLRSFIQHLPEYSGEEIMISALLNFKIKASLSRENGNELLRLIKSFEPAHRVPDDWRSVVRDAERHVSHLNETTLRRIVQWPESFEMHLFDEPGHASLPPVELIARDLLELIATKLVCPTTMYINESEIQFAYRAEQLQDGTSCVSSLMSSEYVRNSEEYIRAINPNGILIPIITYADGVSLGLRNKVCSTICV